MSLPVPHALGRISRPAIGFALLLSPASVVCGQATFQPLGILPGATGSVATAISPEGDAVVGYVITGPKTAEAFLWTTADGMRALGDLEGGEVDSVAYGVSSHGAVVVGQGRGYGLDESVYWTPKSGIVALGTGPLSQANAVSADGATIAGGFIVNGREEAFVWTAATGPIGLGFLPTSGLSNAKAIDHDGDRIVGYCDNELPYIYNAVVWTEGAIAELDPYPGWGITFATAISADGLAAVGYGEHGGQERQAFLWTGGADVIGLGYLPGADESSALGVSSYARAIVGFAEVPGPEQAFVWTPDAGLRDLRTTLLDAGAIGLDGWLLQRAVAVSADASLIVGTGLNPAGNQEAWIASLSRECPPDLDHSGSLDLFDFLAFTNLFNTQDPAADCTADGTFDLFDFLCFVNAFNAGC